MKINHKYKIEREPDSSARIEDSLLVFYSDIKNRKFIGGINEGELSQQMQKSFPELKWVHISSENNKVHYLKNYQILNVDETLISLGPILKKLKSGNVEIEKRYSNNLKFVKKYIRGSGGYVIMANNSEIAVSKGRKTEFIEKLNFYAHHL